LPAGVLIAPGERGREKQLVGFMGERKSGSARGSRTFECQGNIDRRAAESAEKDPA